MVRQYFLLSIRNFKRHKGNLLINLIGLISSMTCAVMIYLLLQSELQIDSFHQQKIYQVMQNEHLQDGINTVEGTPGLLAQALPADFPEVKYAVTTSPGYWLANSKIGSGQHPNLAAAGKFAGPDFFKVFSYPMLYGDSSKVLNGTNSAVVSQALAIKLFNTTDVIGKPIIWSNTELQMEMQAQITGVFKNVSDQSSEPFDFLISTDVLLNVGNSSYKKWYNYGPLTYFVLNNNKDLPLFNTKIKNYLKSKGVNNYTLFTRAYADSYLYNQTENGKITGGRIDYVKLFAFAAVLILLIACINFTNLSTASASRRLKEIGIKKVLGVNRRYLMLQYIMESVLLSFISLLITLVVLELLLPSFNSITGKNLSLNFNFPTVVVLPALALFTGIIAGLYPAIYLSGLKPVTALKGKLQFSISSLWIRQGLVVFQFAISVILIVAVIIIYKQVQYVQTKSQGFQKENVVYFETDGKLKTNPLLAVNAIKQMDGVINAAGIDRELLGDLSYTTGSFDWEGRNQNEVIRFQRADVSAGLLETLGMTMVSGRTFSEKFGSDTTAVIINQAGIKAMRLKNPLGKTFTLWGNKMQIIGVVQDFHFESMHKEVGPMFIRYKPLAVNRIMLRIAPGQIKSVLDRIKTFQDQYNPGYSINYKFLDQDFHRQYISETRMAALAGYFSVVAITISCLGLFGLATFAAEKRFKELGIRKVLGAQTYDLMYILSRDFIKPVLLSILISIPVTYIVCAQWLSTFAYRIDLQWWFFAAGALVALLISSATIFYQTFRASTMNPIKSLKAD